MRVGICVPILVKPAVVASIIEIVVQRTAIIRRHVTQLLHLASRNLGQSVHADFAGSVIVHRSNDSGKFHPRLSLGMSHPARRSVQPFGFSKLRILKFLGFLQLRSLSQLFCLKFICCLVIFRRFLESGLYYRSVSQGIMVCLQQSHSRQRRSHKHRRRPNQKLFLPHISKF